MIYRLTQDDLDDIQRVALSRSRPKLRYDEGNQWAAKSKHSDERHIWGVTCELATARLLGVDIDRSVNDGDKGAGDIIVTRDEAARTIQVKGRTTRGWDFANRTPNPAEFKTDLAVLCWPGRQRNEVDVVGWVARQRFLKYAELADYGYGSRLVLHAKFFLPMESLLEFMEN